MANILIIAPHADDEILGCGGTIAKHVENGDIVSIAIMTNANVGAPELFSEAQIKSARTEAKNAHNYLSITGTYFFEFPAPQLEQHPQYKIANAINQLIQKTKAEILYIPHKGDLHLDHGVIYNASLVAARPVPGQSVRKILAYETLSETEWGHPSVDAVFIPTIFHKLTTQQFEKKLNAMGCFRSQLKPFPNTRSIETIKHLAALRGSTVGAELAESFMLVRNIEE
jgi:LmbE family N-acetylglucosaminyl deacetylase